MPDPLADFDLTDEQRAEVQYAIEHGQARIVTMISGRRRLIWIAPPQRQAEYDQQAHAWLGQFRQMNDDDQC